MKYIPPCRRGIVPDDDGIRENGSRREMRSPELPPYRSEGKDTRYGAERNYSSRRNDGFQSYDRKPSYNNRDRSMNDGYRRDDSKRGYFEDEKRIFDSENIVHTGIDFDQYDDIPVTVNGGGEVEPLESFDDADIAPQILANIKRCGYTRPTPAQKYSIPIVTQNGDLMVCAQTGSGKTAAYLVPALELVLRDQDAQKGQDRQQSRNSRNGMMNDQHSPFVLVLCPTRELACQIHKEAEKLCFRTGLRPCVFYGGTSFGRQNADAHRGCDVLIATPGRLIDFLDRGRLSLEQISVVIFDEADRMLDMGFDQQIRRIVKKSGMPTSRTSLMFSATFPKEIRVLAEDFLHKHAFVTVGRLGSTNSGIEQKFKFIESKHSQDIRSRVDTLLNVLDESDNSLCIVFVATKRMADQLELVLREEGRRCCSIHGDKSQEERDRSLKAFKSGDYPVMVATDVASRGLDIPNVGLVVNFDLPKVIDDYVHRIGRTGRVGNRGTAVSFVAESDSNLIDKLRKLLKETDQKIPAWFDELDQPQKKNGYGSHGYGNGFHRGGGYQNNGNRNFYNKQGAGRSNGFGSRGAERGGGTHDSVAKKEWGDSW